MDSEQKTRERISGEDRRLQIIDAALTLFAEKGFTRTRTHEIAEAAGISETLVFQHFKTKDGLIKSALAALFHSHSLSGELKNKLKETDDAGFFRTIALHFLKHNREDPRIIKLALYSSLEYGHFGELTRCDDTGPSMLILITDYIRKRIDEGIYCNTNPEIAARLFVQAIFMHIVDRSSTITGPALPYPDEKIVDTLVDIYLSGLKKK